MRCLWFWSNFQLPVCWSSGVCSCVAGEFVWYVLLWNLLALGWCLVSVWVWRCLMSSYWLMFPEFRSSLMFSGFGLKPPASGFQSYFYGSLKTFPSIQHCWQNISFWRHWAAFLGAWCLLPAFRSCFVEFTQHLNVRLMNLWGRKWCPSPIPLPS